MSVSSASTGKFCVSVEYGGGGTPTDKCVWGEVSHKRQASPRWQQQIDVRRLQAGFGILLFLLSTYAFPSSLSSLFLCHSS